DIMCRDITVHVGNNTLRQVVCFNLVVQSELAQTGSTVPVAADDALDHAFMAVVVTAGAITVALAGCEEQGQIFRMAGLQEALFQRLGQGLRAGAAYKAASGDGIAVLDFEGSFL